MGVAHSKLDNNIAAEQAFRSAMMLDPDTKDWKMGLAESYFKQGRFADAAALMEELVGANSGAILLEVRESNAAARGLYARFGFREVGRRSAYYHRPVEDALVLRRG